jgi:hypothetical protein
MNFLKGSALWSALFLHFFNLAKEERSLVVVKVIKSGVDQEVVHPRKHGGSCYVF